MTKVSASLLGADFARIGEEVKRAEAAGVDSFHIDFMDGHYVPNIALAPYHLEAIAPLSDLPLEVHLEIENPDELLAKFKPFPADMIIVQWDSSPDPDATFDRIRSWGARVGIGLLPLASVDPVIPIFDQLDMLLLLGVQPGFGGQGMVDGTLAWLESVAKIRDAHAPSLPISVDGGVKGNNAGDVVRAGADILIMGSGLFEVSDMESLIQKIKPLKP
jgi:ribulose-phosphate 3-epimerase